MGTSIRPAQASDEDRLRGLDAATWSPDVTPAPARPLDRPFLDSSSESRLVLVAEANDIIVGYVSLGRSLVLPSNRHVIEIQGLAVDPAQHRRGHGRALLTAAVGAAAASGARRLTLRVLGPNTAARRLYEAHGFVVEGVLREEFWLDGRYVDDVLMARSLPSDAGHLSGPATSASSAATTPSGV